MRCGRVDNACAGVLMKLKIISLLLIGVVLLIVLLIAGWLVLIGVIIAASALTWFVTNPPPYQDEALNVIVIDGLTWIDGVDYKIS